MARQDEIARFVAGFFTLNGAVLRWVDAGVLEVEVPEALRSRLGVCRKLRLAFSPRAAESGPDQRVEYLTLGHPLLDRLLDEARSRGRTASVILPHGLDRELLEALSTANPFGTRSSRNRSGSTPAAELREGSRPKAGGCSGRLEGSGETPGEAGFPRRGREAPRGRVLCSTRK